LVAALGRLVRASQHRHVMLREMAARLIETGQEPEKVTL
jgi:ribosomal protein L17